MPLSMAREQIETRIFLIRNQRVMVDADLAEIYGVSTKRLNEQVKRNCDRFPEDFMFQLTEEEKVEVVANCDHLKNLKYSRSLPFAFTEYGALMLANILKSTQAVQASIQVVRAFIHLRELLSTHKALAKKLESLEEKYDTQFKVVFDAIRELMTPNISNSRHIGFHQKAGKDG